MLFSQSEDPLMKGCFIEEMCSKRETSLGFSVCDGARFKYKLKGVMVYF
jgi:hypothetical protein